VLRGTVDRLEPSQLRPEEIDQLEDVLNDSPCLIGREDFRLELPDPIFHLLLHVVRMMRKGEVILLMPEDECVSTQSAAEYLGVSRPFLVKLLEEEKIPHYKTGTHRRIRLKDLRTYRDQRDQERSAGLRALFDKIQEAGHYEDSE
jgi:excisionase family DNA binding protein